MTTPERICHNLLWTVLHVDGTSRLDTDLCTRSAAASVMRHPSSWAVTSDKIALTYDPDDNVWIIYATSATYRTANIHDLMRHLVTMHIRHGKTTHDTITAILLQPHAPTDVYRWSQMAAPGDVLKTNHVLLRKHTTTIELQMADKHVHVSNLQQELLDAIAELLEE